MTSRDGGNAEYCQEQFPPRSDAATSCHQREAKNLQPIRAPIGALIGFLVIATASPVCHRERSEAISDHHNFRLRDDIKMDHC
jgi:hypothetical protein